MGKITIYSNAGIFGNFLRKIYTLTIEYAIKNSPKQIHLNEKGKDSDQGDSSKSQRTKRVSSISAEASLTKIIMSRNVYDFTFDDINYQSKSSSYVAIGGHCYATLIKTDIHLIAFDRFAR